MGKAKRKHVKHLINSLDRAFGSAHRRGLTVDEVINIAVHHSLNRAVKGGVTLSAYVAALNRAVHAEGLCPHCDDQGPCLH